MDIDKNILFLLIKHKVDFRYLEYFDSVEDIIELVNFLEKDIINNAEIFRIATQVAVSNILSSDTHVSMLDLFDKDKKVVDEDTKKITEEERLKTFEEAKKLFNLE